VDVDGKLAHPRLERQRRLQRRARARTAYRSDRGVALVEFAIVLPVLTLLLLGLLDFGRALSYWLDGKHLAHQGARWAAVARNPGAPGASLQQYVRNQAETSEMKNNLIVCIEWPGDDGDGVPEVGEPVRVRTRVTFTWLEFIRGKLGIPTTIELKGASTQRMEVVPGSSYSPANNPAGCT
jgi:hypothetical protein